jgi:chaperonin GroEL (HSP60 family)
LKTWEPDGKRSVSKTNDLAGDGTTATVLAQAYVKKV